jgi:hypothetical protein
MRRFFVDTFSLCFVSECFAELGIVFPAWIIKAQVLTAASFACLPAAVLKEMGAYLLVESSIESWPASRSGIS